MPVGTSTDTPDILVGPQVPGSAKSLLLCRHCDGAILKGPLGKAKPARRDLWTSYIEVLTREARGSAMEVLHPFRQENHHGGTVVDESVAAAHTSKQNLTVGGGVTGQARFADLTQEEYLAHAKRMTAALDEVLEAAVARAGIDPTTWDEGAQDFLTAFLRLILMNAMEAYDQARECGALDRDLPFLQLLFGLRPAMKASSDAWAKSGGAPGPDSPVKGLVALAGPFQLVVGDLVSDDETYIRVQKRLYPELGEPS